MHTHPREQPPFPAGCRHPATMRMTASVCPYRMNINGVHQGAGRTTAYLLAPVVRILNGVDQGQTDTVTALQSCTRARHSPSTRTLPPTFRLTWPTRLIAWYPRATNSNTATMTKVRGHLVLIAVTCCSSATCLDSWSCCVTLPESRLPCTAEAAWLGQCCYVP